MSKLVEWLEDKQKICDEFKEEFKVDMIDYSPLPVALEIIKRQREALENYFVDEDSDYDLMVLKALSINPSHIEKELKK